MEDNCVQIRIDQTLYLDTLRVVRSLRKHNRPSSLLKCHRLWLIFRYHQHLLAWFWAAHEDLVQNITAEESSYDSDSNICRLWEPQQYPLHPFSLKWDAINRRELGMQQKDRRQQAQAVAGEILTRGKKSFLKAGLSTAQRSDRSTGFGSF